jgi:simple sugar transport system ATP-binding protein
LVQGGRPLSKSLTVKRFVLRRCIIAAQAHHILEMKNIAIEFPGVKALQGVDFTVHTGRIQALIGANGAGKSTLMKILAGAYSHYTGSIRMDGQEVDIHTPRASKAQGIEIVFQEVDTALVPSLSVAENIMLDVMVNKMGGRQWINWAELHRSAQAVLERMGVQLETRLLAQELSLAQKQMILIARALCEEAQFLVLDEPTAPLSIAETRELFRLIKELAANHGVGIVFISHRLPEIFEICEELTILRDGQVVTCQPTAGLTSLQVVEWMLGHRFSETYPKTQVSIGGPLLEIRDLTARGEQVRQVSLRVNAGEIVGLAGLVGAGKTELCKAIFGALPVKHGEIRLRGALIQVRTPHQAVRSGLALVPEERRKEGILVEEPLFVNLSLSNLAIFAGFLGFLRKAAEKLAARRIVAELAIKTPSEQQKVAYLSGGNQQKVVVGKWLNTDADVYIFDEPTKGVDIGAKHEIFVLIGKLAAAGKGILYASCELAEIMGITDRTYVMYDRTIVKELVTADTTESEILFYSTGGK